jgi:hypothetical protein
MSAKLRDFWEGENVYLVAAGEKKSVSIYSWRDRLGKCIFPADRLLQVVPAWLVTFTGLRDFRKHAKDLRNFYLR